MKKKLMNYMLQLPKMFACMVLEQLKELYEQ